MTTLSRRLLIAGATAATLLAAACGNGLNSSGGAKIDARVDATLDYLYTTYPGTKALADESAGMLVMPLVTEAGLGIGGSFGRGALQIDGITVDYYAAFQGSVGLQIGAQQYAHVLFFMTDKALQDFRTSDGWAVGADIEYAYKGEGQTLSAETTTQMYPVKAVIFGQAGFIAGASIEGTKYRRIIP